MRLTISLLISSCATGCAASPDSFCVAARPIHLSDQADAAMDRSDMLQVQELNDTYSRLCK